MKRKALFNIASSSLIIAGSMVGCSGAAFHERAGASAGKLSKMALSQSRDAENALAKHDAGKAIQIAEAAVAAEGHNADYRTLLGRAYLMAGRFDSAKTAFQDALTLGARDPRTIVNLSLILIAQGDRAAAQSMLTDHLSDLPAADYGLAMAMAGRPDEAVRVLSRAIHAPGATAKERQNLAYSYALSGHWVEARQMASFDLPPLEAAKRVASWAQMAQPGAESQRVIAMMGVAPRADDAGLPVRLALASPASPPAQMAEAKGSAAATSLDEGSDVPPVIAYSQYASSDQPTGRVATAPLLAAAPASVSVAAPAQALNAVPVRFAQADAVRAPEFVPVPREEPVRAGADRTPLSPILSPAPSHYLKAEASVAQQAALWRPVNPTNGSRWVVQLGAFSTRKLAQAGWAHYVRNNEKLGLFPLVNSEIMLDGRQLHRVAIAGFGDRTGAVTLCTSIRARGGDCFVREGGIEAEPSRWALAKTPRLLAMK